MPAQCTIPDSKLAETLLEKQLLKFGRNTWLESRKSKVNDSQAKAKSGDWECGEWYTRWVCELHTDEDGNTYVIHGECTEVGPFCAYSVYVESEDSGGGGGGFDSEDPGECDPLGIEPCFDDGGGASIPPPDPCDEDDPPSYCECEDTGNDVLDNTVLQVISETLWDKQNSLSVEHGGFLYRNALGDWQFFELEGDWVISRTKTRLKFYVPSNSLPDGSIYVHTHPTESSFTTYGIPRKYEHKPSGYDEDAMQRMSSEYGVAYGIILDPVYRILVGPDGKVIDKVTRCGY